MSNNYRRDCDLGDGQMGPVHKKARLSNGFSNESKKDENIQQQRQALPIYSARYRLIKEVSHHNTVIIIGETGSGKTTQIPQFLYTTALHRLSTIGITQPRRVAAISIASRVAQEMKCNVGELVGYSVRFEDATSSNTKIKYLTDGMLLREAVLDPLLKKYSIIILDEAHERTVHTDILFGIVKTAQKERRIRMCHPLKIIVMSATMNVDQFSQYFNNAPVLYIEGRQFPVQIMYTKEIHEDYSFSALVTIYQIHQTAPPQHDILVFLTGQDEIESMVRTILEINKTLPDDCPHMKICSLYAALPSTLQLHVFQPTPKDTRKVILATNIAETSITIPGIKYVIDVGMVKARTHLSGSGFDILKVQRISQAQAWQRAGRAGRESRGICYRTYTEKEFETYEKFSIPEILRCNLASVILQLLAIGIDDVFAFNFMDKPTDEAVQCALNQLYFLGAVEKQEKFRLTPLGRNMASFPLDPRFSKIILASKDMGCSEEVINIISLLSVESILYTAHNKKEQAAAALEKFISSEGDHLTYLNILRAFKGANCNKNWCLENFFHFRNLKLACEVQQQLLDLCRRLSISLQSSRDTSVARKCLTVGMFMNVAEYQKEGHYISLDSQKVVHIHPSSCLFKCKPAYVIYTELIQTSKCYMRDLSIINPDWLQEVVPSHYKRNSSSFKFIKKE